MRLLTRAVVRLGLLWAVVGGFLVIAYGVALALRGDGLSENVAGALGLVTSWLPVAVCWMTVQRVGFWRLDMLFAAAAVTSYAVGNTYYLVVLASGGTVPLPSLADLGYLLFYPLMLTSLTLAVRRRAHGRASALSWDSIVGSLGAVSLLAVVLQPVIDTALASSLSLATVVALAYPAFDLVLVASVAGIVALRGVRVSRRASALLIGLLIFAATDVVYARLVANNDYVFGTPVSAGWTLGLALIAIWVDGAEAGHGHGLTARADGSARTSAAVLAVPVFATMAALAVLIVGSRTRLPLLAVVLAGVTLLAATVRTQVAFRELARMADLRRREATTDALTGLPNRRALSLEADARLLDRDRPQALLLLDLDKFKEVNDSLGHRSGDLLLVQVSERLREQVRAADLLVRLGGDEFAVLLDDAGREQTAAAATTMHGVLAETFTLEGVALHSSVSIGISMFPDDGPDLSSLLRKADIAMYKAKSSGDSHHFYGSDDHSDGAARLQTVEDLRTAMTTDQLMLHYQPKIDLSTGDVHSVEALVRWDHPTRGLLYPDAFLALVEETGLMRAMTRLVLEMALDQTVAWRAQGLRDLTVAVNLSASSLVDSDLPEQVADMLAARGVPPHALQLEITEEFLMADRDRARSVLAELRRNGVQISVDDFGTGYSSLSYLRELPIDELKLDRSFVFPMADDARAAALVASTIGLAHSLGLRMVAEGVETQVAYTELARLECDQAQGYFISRPVPAVELEHWLGSRSTNGGVATLPQPRTSARRGDAEPF